MTNIASHRGGTLEFGDSTRAGFAATAMMDVEQVEFDLHPTLDGRIIVNHDATLDRTTDMSGPIAQMPAGDVRRARVSYAGADFPHLLFIEELCALYRSSTVDFRCEIKPGHDGRPYADFVPQVVATLDKGGMLERTGFSSFLLEILDELHLATTRPVLWLVGPQVLCHLGTRGVIETACARGLKEISVPVDLAGPDLMQAATEAGLDFGCWGAHSRPQINKVLDLNVKTFTTDRPGLAIAIRNQRRDPKRGDQK